MPTVGLYENLVLERPNRKLKFIYWTYWVFCFYSIDFKCFTILVARLKPNWKIVETWMMCDKLVREAKHYCHRFTELYTPHKLLIQDNISFPLTIAALKAAEPQRLQGNTHKSAISWRISWESDLAQVRGICYLAAISATTVLSWGQFRLRPPDSTR